MISSGEWTVEEMEGDKASDDEMIALGLRGILRKYELADGPDRMRDTLVHRLPDGSEVGSAINDPQARVALWDAYFADEAEMIRARHRRTA